MAAVADQIEALTGTNPEAGVLADVYERSGGNALLVEEVVLTGAPGDVAGPGRLDELVVARVEQLSMDGRSLAEAVAIAGAPVEQQLLSDYAGWDAARFAGALREAIDAQVLSVSSRDERVRFRHVLLAEAVVGAMLEIERRASHSRWAEVLQVAGPVEPMAEASPDSERLQLIAQHYAAQRQARPLCAGRPERRASPRSRCSRSGRPGSTTSACSTRGPRSTNPSRCSGSLGWR